LAKYQVARHTRGNAQGVKALRPNVRVVPLSDFKTVHKIEELCVKLFGKALSTGNVDG
jgi:hypothetical protein